MRKIFTLFAAMLLTITASATKMNITPTSWEGGTVDDRSLYRAVTQSTVDTIVLGAGTYIESQSISIATDRNVVMIAADGAKPLVKCSGYFDVYASVVAKGIKFQFVGETGNGYGFYVHDNAHKYIKLEGCTFLDYTQPCVEEASSSYHLDSLLVDDCQFYNIGNSCIHLKETTESRVVVSNSTFANIDASAVDAAVLETRTATGVVKVDNCTFYNCSVKNYDYGAIKCASNSNVVISNNIVALPVPDARANKIRAIHVQSKVIKNCLTFNYVQNSNTGMRDGTYENCLINTDPLFADTTNLDFTLDAENSPAHEAGVGGTHLGDPRWWPTSWAPVTIIPVSDLTLNSSELALVVDEAGVLTATVSPDDATDKTVLWASSNNSIARVTDGVVEGLAVGEATITATAGSISKTCTVTVTAATIPSTNLSEPLTLLGKKAHIEGNIWKNANSNLYYNNKSTQGVASWKITVEQPCVVTGTVNGIVKTGQYFELDLYDSGDNRIDSIANPHSRAWGNGGNPNVALDSTGHSTLTFPAAGIYTLKLRNEMTWSSCEFASLTLTKETNLMDIYLNAGVWNAAGAKFGIYIREEGWWPEFMELVSGDIYVVHLFPENKRYLNFARFADTKVSPSDGDIWNQVVNLNRDYSNDYMVITGWGSEGYSTGEWKRIANIADGYYVIGLSTWTPNDLTASYKLTANPAEEGEYILENVTLEVGNSFKVIKVENTVLTNWYGAANDDNYDVTADVAGVKTIYFNPTAQSAWSNGHIYVPLNDPTAIDNTVVGEKAVKFFENGQLFIQKDGKTYNILGTIVK